MAATRPVSGQPIETAWGDQVHDAVVTAKGVVVTSAAAVTTGKCPLDVVVMGDPALVNLATDELVASVAGVWEVSATVTGGGYTGGTAGAAYRAICQVNGSSTLPAGWAGVAMPTWTSNGVNGSIHGLLVLAAGDKVTIVVTGVGAGGNIVANRVVFMLRAQALG